MNENNKKQSSISCEICPLVHTFDVIGGKWRIPIIWQLSVNKSMRYNEIKRSLPKITNIMLTRSLQSLEQYGLVKRVEYNKIPPHVEYSLTDRCNDLLPALVIMNEWSKKLLKLQK
ncbi:DNA-binding HxlR family transcriptional regulator [Clostridium acetobutylicum]|uniref:Predicted transcriptional regulator n=1 Tax=Clostridium acetobutylicum (strain ATCC 824 / DSM 792 / JCM 1419 / IAM 19013 / LMG 5710 / NBRC 13948 / NRRL B-527 / VKM B-1787 / 2291 / W) TaxID=272562 RepID=Q97MK1_CLOAB|nr:MULTISPECIES: helix-turn-helix domain-containing protein [Clostridium]AAK78177.1 Predicted transcriptional regulator [Clostridium acetobutylicum ATCC 824]AEI31103.1 transcriptional regulator [Clostridium acetobutylicum DSM 1731]AWV81984.1 transcriptional regulator [Clostridium acetobutylicum]MBC2395947.1 helix-turn-helix transcriptional regulator [Clostridium acetobutylicum]MBC2586158.1 helix-turn-helix transcriptional regulator [Clostridium acetobutylicum]